MSATAAPADLTSPSAGTTEGHARSWGFTVLGVVRILIGFYFLWAFADKLFGLCYSTPSERSWLNGGSPTAGFLGGSIEGGNPFAGVWQFFIDLNPVTNILFMVGLFAIGVAFLLGIGMRIAAASGFVMYMLMFLAAFPLVTNPIIDDHVIVGVLMLAMAGLAAGDHLGLGRQWRELVGRKAPYLI